MNYDLRPNTMKAIYVIHFFACAKLRTKEVKE